jgi:curved DNA-binding protein CbpA
MDAGQSWPRTLHVNDWYEVLGVSPSASSEEIAAAFARLVPLERNPNESEDEAEERRLREYAYAVLHDPDSRARYDAERAAAGASQSSMAAQPANSGAPAPAPRRGGVPLGPLVAAFGILAAICAVVALVFVFAMDDDDGGSAYPNREDDGDYDLEAMRLRDQDMPMGFEWTNSVEFSNDEWGSSSSARRTWRTRRSSSRSSRPSSASSSRKGASATCCPSTRARSSAAPRHLLHLHPLHRRPGRPIAHALLRPPVDERRNLELRALQLPTWATRAPASSRRE